MTQPEWDDDKIREAGGEQRCSLCSDRIRVGDDIYPIMGKGWSHAECVRRAIGAVPVVQS